VHQLVIKGFNIVDARCNHEVYAYYMFRPNWTTVILISILWYSLLRDDGTFRSMQIVTRFIKSIQIFLFVIDGELSLLLFSMTL